MLTGKLPDTAEVVTNVVYDGCDSIRWLKHRGLLNSQVSITIDKTELVITQEGLQGKRRGRSLLVGVLP